MTSCELCSMPKALKRGDGRPPPSVVGHCWKGSASVELACMVRTLSREHQHLPELIVFWGNRGIDEIMLIGSHKIMHVAGQRCGQSR